MAENEDQELLEAELLDAFRRLPASRKEDAVKVVKDLRRPEAASSYRHLSGDESLLISYYRRLHDDYRVMLREKEQELLDQQEEMKAWQRSFQRVAPELLDWSTDIAGRYGGSFIDRMLAISRLEEQINLRLPAGVWFSVEKAYPVMNDVDGFTVDYDLPAEEWHQICHEANQAVVEAAERDYIRANMVKPGEGDFEK